jgi:branched-chain amino acid transport system substrate-binding protein
LLPIFIPAHAETGEAVKIVSSLPRTGSANSQTTAMVNGIRMALDEAGKQAGGFSLHYDDWDDASPERGNWDPAVEASNADRAIKDPDIVAYIGTYNSGAAKISMPKLNAASLAMISPANTAVGLTKPGMGEPGEPEKYRPSGKVTYFRVVPADDIQGSMGAKWARELGAKSVYVLHDREVYGQGLAAVFRNAAEKNGIKVVAFEGIDTKAANYRSLATKVKQRGADLVYFGGTTQTNAGQIAKDLRAGGVKAKLMFPDGCFETAFIEAAGREAVASDVFLTFGGVPANRLTGKGKTFYENYLKRFGSEPEAYAAYGYEAASVVIDAIRRAGMKDRAAIVDALASTKDFTGALGTWSFDANGDTSLRSMSGNTIRDGKFEFLKVLTE